MINQINEDLLLLKYYFANNLLTLNLSKTKFMVFRSARKILPNLTEPEIGTTSIEYVTSFKYLGVHLDSTLSWEVHIKHVERKVASLCGIVRKVVSFIPRHVLIKFYYAHIHSRLQYLVSVWGRACKSKLIKLQVLQNRCIKLIFKLPILHPTLELYSNELHNILPLLALCELQTLLLVHDILHNPNVHCNLVMDGGNRLHNTRQHGHLTRIRAVTNLGQKRISCVGSVRYNSLPIELKENINRSLFKTRLKKYLKTKSNDFLL